MSKYALKFLRLHRTTSSRSESSYNRDWLKLLERTNTPHPQTLYLNAGIHQVTRATRIAASLRGGLRSLLYGVCYIQLFFRLPIAIDKAAMLVNLLLQRGKYYYIIFLSRTEAIPWNPSMNEAFLPSVSLRRRASSKEKTPQREAGKPVWSLNELRVTPTWRLWKRALGEKGGEVFFSTDACWNLD